MVCLFGLDRLLSPGERSVDQGRYIAFLPIYVRCPRASKITPATRTFYFIYLFFFEDKRSSLHSRSLFSKLAFFLQREIDRSFWMSPLRSSGQDNWPGETSATPGVTIVKVAPNLDFFQCQRCTSTSSNIDCVFQASWKKKQSFKAMLGQESASEEYRKQRFLHDRTAGMPRTSCPGRNNTIGLFQCRFFLAADKQCSLTCFTGGSPSTSRGVWQGCGEQSSRVPSWPKSERPHANTCRDAVIAKVWLQPHTISMTWWVGKSPAVNKQTNSREKDCKHNCFPILYIFQCKQKEKRKRVFISKIRLRKTKIQTMNTGFIAKSQTRVDY